MTFPGLSMGIFSGDLRFTAYRGTNLLRMDALATTNEEWVAYKYEAGLKGFSTELTPRVTWRDTGGHAAAVRVRRRRQQDASCRSRRRTGCWSRKARADRSPPSRRRTPSSSRAKSTPTSATSGTGRTRRRRFGIGIRQADGEEVAQYVENFALFNAPPGTVQQMGVYFYASPDSAEGDAAGGARASRTATSSSRCRATRRS